MKRGALPREEGRAAIDATLDAGWYCAPDRYAELVGKLEVRG